MEFSGGVKLRFPVGCFMFCWSSWAVDPGELAAEGERPLFRGRSSELWILS